MQKHISPVIFLRDNRTNLFVCPLFYCKQNESLLEGCFLKKCVLRFCRSVWYIYFLNLVLVLVLSIQRSQLLPDYGFIVTSCLFKGVFIQCFAHFSLENDLSPRKYQKCTELHSYLSFIRQSRRHSLEVETLVNKLKLNKVLHLPFFKYQVLQLNIIYHDNNSKSYDFYMISNPNLATSLVDLFHLKGQNKYLVLLMKFVGQSFFALIWQFQVRKIQ